MTARGATDTLALLRARCAALPDVIDHALSVPLPVIPHGDLVTAPWVTTGTGTSEGPAHALATLLRQTSGCRAEFVPLSCFADETPPDGLVVVFSQSISPNARLALNTRQRSRKFLDRTLLVTAAGASPEIAALARQGLCVLNHPPSDESGLLLRVLGPAAALVIAHRIAATVHASLSGTPTLMDTNGLRSVLATASARADLALTGINPVRLLGRVALVTTGGADAHGLRWKWLEGLGCIDPPVWDVMQFAHGPYQYIVDEDWTLIALERAGAPGRKDPELLDRLGAILHPDRHALVRLRATGDGLMGTLDHDAQLNQVLLRAMEKTPRDIIQWPGQGGDEELYGIGRSPAHGETSTATGASSPTQPPGGSHPSPRLGSSAAGSSSLLSAQAAGAFPAVGADDGSAP